MKWYNKLQFLAMMLTVAGVGAEWHFGLWMTISLGGATIISIVAQLITQHSIGNPGLRWPLKVGLWALVAYWLMLLASTLYSADLPTAKQLLILKGTLLIFPLAVLLTDTSWLGTKQLRWLGYALTLSLLGSFLYHGGVGVGELLDGKSVSSVLNTDFDERHHAYSALYIVAAMLFVYHELYSRWSSLAGWWRGLLLAAEAVFIVYVTIVNSRAGELAMYAVELFIVLHFALTRRRWLQAGGLALLLAGVTVGAGLLIHGDENRIAETISDVSGDVRIEIYKNDLDAAMESPIRGHGAGDYHGELKKKYDENNFEAGKKASFNAHNQYLETVLSIGFIGLATMLLWLLWPLWMAWRGLRKGHVAGSVFWLVLMLTFCLAFSFMFESMLERQMGLLFVGALIPIITLIVSNEENKFGQLPKK